MHGANFIFHLILTHFRRQVPFRLLRKDILGMFKDLRSSCPNSHNICSSISLRRIRRREGIAEDEFDLYLKWVPDERSRTFLKSFALERNLTFIQTENSIILASSRS